MASLMFNGNKVHGAMLDGKLLFDNTNTWHQLDYSKITAISGADQYYFSEDYVLYNIDEVQNQISPIICLSVANSNTVILDFGKIVDQITGIVNENGNNFISIGLNSSSRTLSSIPATYSGAKLTLDMTGVDNSVGWPGMYSFSYSKLL